MILILFKSLEKNYGEKHEKVRIKKSGDIKLLSYLWFIN